MPTDFCQLWIIYLKSYATDGKFSDEYPNSLQGSLLGLFDVICLNDAYGIINNSVSITTEQVICRISNNNFPDKVNFQKWLTKAKKNPLQLKNVGSWV